MVDGMPIDEQYLSFDQVKTLFHELVMLSILPCATPSINITVAPELL
jgi:hypothetical protein